MTPGPLAATLGRRDAASEHCRYVAGRPQPDDRWLSLGTLLDDPAILAGWYHALVERDGAPDLAGSFLAGWIADVVTDGVAAAVREERRAWRLDPAGLLVHRHEESWFDGLAVLDPTVRVLSVDPDSGHADAVVVADVDALPRHRRGRHRRRRHAVVRRGPGAGAVRARAACGARWATASWAGRCGRLTKAAATSRRPSPRRWRSSTRSRARAPLRARPALQVVAWSGGTAHVARKSTCCLWYKRPPEPGTDGYCLACPLLDPDDQQSRWAAWFEERAGAR